MGGAQTWGAPEESLARSAQGLPRCPGQEREPRFLSESRRRREDPQRAGGGPGANHGRPCAGGAELGARALRHLCVHSVFRVPSAVSGGAQEIVRGPQVGAVGLLSRRRIPRRAFCQRPEQSLPPCRAAPCLPAAAEPSGPPVLTFSSASRFVSSPCPFPPPCPLRRDSLWIRAERLLRGFRRG